jgi:hypothetical protein
VSGYSTTPNLSLKKPISGADDDMWGTHWNDNADALDAALATPGGLFLPADGRILPTSDVGLSPGSYWNNGGFVCIKS